MRLLLSEVDRPSESVLLEMFLRTYHAGLGSWRLKLGKHLSPSSSWDWTVTPTLPAHWGQWGVFR